MSWLSSLWRRVKGGRTDAQVAFGVIVGTLSTAERNDLWEKLSMVQKAVDIAARHYAGPDLDIAKTWVNGALAILEAKK
jgi:hypothetical protein